MEVEIDGERHFTVKEFARRAGMSRDYIRHLAGPNTDTPAKRRKEQFIPHVRRVEDRVLIHEDALNIF